MNEDNRTVEHSERARYVTELVAMWIVNDEAHYKLALERAGRDGGVAQLEAYLRRALRNRQPICGTGLPTAAWHVAQELAANDYDRIHWGDVADVLLAE